VTEPAAEPVSWRRGYAAALALLVTGAALMLLAHGQVWVSATVGGSGLPTLHVDLTGRDLQPEGTAAALVALAAVAALVATRRVGRLLTGAVLLVVGAGAALRALQFVESDAGSSAPDGAVGRLVAERTGVGVSGLTLVHSAWWAVAVLGGVLVAVAGVVVLLGSSSWSVLGGRYERRDDSAAGVHADPGPRPESAWDQLDRGLDPTADTTPDPTLGDGPLA